MLFPSTKQNQENKLSLSDKTIQNYNQLTTRSVEFLTKGSHPKQKVTFLWTLSVRGGGAQPHSIAFGGVLTNFTEAIFG